MWGQLARAHRVDGCYFPRVAASSSPPPLTTQVIHSDVSPTMGQVYIANDEDWEQDEHGNLVLVADYEDENWGGDDDGVPPAKLATRGVDQRPPEARKRVSDVLPEVYWDDSALVNCWAAALVDFKVSFQIRYSSSRGFGEGVLMTSLL